MLIVFFTHEDNGNNVTTTQRYYTNFKWKLLSEQDQNCVQYMYSNQNKHVKTCLHVFLYINVMCPHI